MQNNKSDPEQLSAKKAQLKGRLLKLSGLVMFSVAGVLAYIGTANYIESEGHSFLPFILSLLGIPLIVYGKQSYKRGKLLNARSADNLLSKDTRPPVLYLRSFIEDETTSSEIGPSGLVEIAVKSLVVSGSTVFSYFFNKSEEEHLANIFRKLGPCIAIGIPGEQLPPLGMARMHLPEEEWQAKVQELLSRARAVVLRAGHTKNFWWEVDQAIKLVRPERLLFLLPFPTHPALAGRESSRYVKFRKDIEQHLPCKLPEFHGASIEEGSLTGVLFFGPDWSPHVVAFHKFGRTLPLKTLLKKALKPFFAQLKRGNL
jgi:hypothetical protein